VNQQLFLVLVSSAVTLAGAFGSILLKNHLDDRRELRKLDPSKLSDDDKSGIVGEKTSSINIIRIVSLNLLMGFVAGISIEIKFGDYDENKLGFFVGLSVFVCSICYLIYFVRHGSFLGYQLCIFTLWAAFLIGASIVMEQKAGGEIFLLFWGIFAILGAIFFIAKYLGTQSRL
jgi:hypothetical protein